MICHLLLCEYLISFFNIYTHDIILVIIKNKNTNWVEIQNHQSHATPHSLISISRYPSRISSFLENYIHNLLNFKTDTYTIFYNFLYLSSTNFLSTYYNYIICLFEQFFQITWFKMYILSILRHPHYINIFIHYLSRLIW